MSSTLAFTGGLGQLDIAAAGAFLDALARRRAPRAGRSPFTVAAHWDPYQWDGWLVAAAAGGARRLAAGGGRSRTWTAWGIPAGAERRGAAPAARLRPAAGRSWPRATSTA